MPNIDELNLFTAIHIVVMSAVIAASSVIRTGDAAGAAAS